MILETTGNTRLLAVIGDPVRHSLSPKIHSRFIHESGLDYIYMAFPVKSGGAAEFFQTARLLDIGGFNVTMPLKEEAFRLADVLGETVPGAVNTVVNKNGLMTGYNTDAKGFLRALESAGRSPSGMNALILGAGGTAKTLAGILSGAGANVCVCARNKEKARELSPRAFTFSGLNEVCENIGLLVNATPLGMNGFGCFDDLGFIDGLPKHALVFDMVYSPRETELLVHARSRGLDGINGLSHLVHQAALSFMLFTGAAPDERTLAQLIDEL